MDDQTQPAAFVGGIPSTIKMGHIYGAIEHEEKDDTILCATNILESRLSSLVIAELKELFPEYANLWKDELFRQTFNNKLASKPQTVVLDAWFKEVVSDYRKKNFMVSGVCQNCTRFTAYVRYSDLISDDTLIEPIECSLCKVWKSVPMTNIIERIYVDVKFMFGMK